MTDLEIDPATARIGAGVKGGKVMEEAAPYGLAPIRDRGTLLRELDD